MSKVEVLVTTMHQSDLQKFTQMNLQADAVIANQTDRNGYAEAEIGVIQERKGFVGSSEHIRTHAENAFLCGGQGVFALPRDFIERAAVERQNLRGAEALKDGSVHGGPLSGDRQKDR